MAKVLIIRTGRNKRFLRAFSASKFEDMCYAYETVMYISLYKTYKHSGKNIEEFICSLERELI